MQTDAKSLARLAIVLLAAFMGVVLVIGVAVSNRPRRATQAATNGSSIPATSSPARAAATDASTSAPAPSPIETTTAPSVSTTAPPTTAPPTIPPATVTTLPSRVVSGAGSALGFCRYVVTLRDPWADVNLATAAPSEVRRALAEGIAIGRTALPLAPDAVRSDVKIVLDRYTAVDAYLSPYGYDVDRIGPQGGVQGVIEGMRLFDGKALAASLRVAGWAVETCPSTLAAG